MQETATIKVNDKSIELPLVLGSEGETGIDIGNLRAKTKSITLDPGFVNTGSCESKITFLVTSAVTLGLPSLSPPIQDPNSIGLKFFGKPLSMF